MEIKLLFTWCMLCLLSLPMAAQTDTIPKKNKEAKTHFGAYYSIGLNNYSVSSNSLTTESFVGNYQNLGFIVETKLYRKLWLELNLNSSLKREGRLNFKQDTFNADILLKNSIEYTVFVYIKYQIWNKRKWSIMTKLGVGFGAFNTETYSKDNSRKQTEYFFYSKPIGDQNYYTFSTGFDINYKIKKHFIIFNQVLFNVGANVLKRSYYLYTGNLSRPVQAETIAPQTFIYSLGIKF